MKKIAFLLALASMLMLVSCGNEVSDTTATVPEIDSRIIGTWKYESYSDYRELITTLINDPSVYYDVYYIFNDDGTGETYISTAEGKMTFTYTFREGKLTITSADGTSFDTKCNVEGNEMTIHDDSSDEDLLFERQ